MSNIILNEAAMVSHAGNRAGNEDCIRISKREDEVFIALADGLGGHGRGEVASAMASDMAISIFESKNVISGKELLAEIFEECQKKLLAEQKKNNDMTSLKTTLVLCHANKECVTWGHIGDSRLYLFRHGRIMERTYDHSVPQMLAAAKKIRESQIRFHEDRNKLLRVLGEEWHGLKYELHNPIKREGLQAVLLCSDGFWELIEEKMMQKCLRKADNVQDWIDAMEKVVLENGRGRDMDNYSAVGVWL